MRIAIATLSLAALFAIHHSEAGASGPAIARVWHGRVSAARADEYAKYLAESIKKFRAIPGNRGYQMMREDAGPKRTSWSSASGIRATRSTATPAPTSPRCGPLPRDGEFLIEPEATVRNYDLVV